MTHNNGLSNFDNLANLVKEAAKVREASYVSNRPTEIGSDSIITTYGEYELSIDEACEKVAKERGLSIQYARLASLMLFSYWNDALDWADSQKYPIEMQFVEICYAVSNKLHMENDLDLDRLSRDTLARNFSDSARAVRASLYDFGTKD